MEGARVGQVSQGGAGGQAMTPPLFDYVCPHCGATCEDKLEPYDAIFPLCHSCGEAEMERQVSQTGPWKFGESGK